MENTTFAVGNIIRPKKTLAKNFHYLNVGNIVSAEIIFTFDILADNAFAKVKILKCKHPVLCDSRNYVIIGVGKPAFQAIDGSEVIVNLSLFEQGYLSDTEAYGNNSLSKYIKIIMLRRTL